MILMERFCIGAFRISTLNSGKRIALERQSPFFGALEGQIRFFLLRTKYFRGQIALEGQRFSTFCSYRHPFAP